MIPWDYDLAFGSFAVDPGDSSSNLFGNYIKTTDAQYGMSSAKSMVNYPIDTPVFKADLEKRPMINQILKIVSTEISIISTLRNLLPIILTAVTLTNSLKQLLI